MLTYDLSQRGDESLYEYLYLCIRTDIESGTIPAGRRLPSKRALAKHLGVSLITVEGAYSQLVAEGYVRAAPRRGYFACQISALAQPVGTRGRREVQPASSGSAAAPVPSAAVSGSPAGAASDSPAPAAPLIADFSGGSLPASRFPFASWAKTVREVLSRESEQALLGDSCSQGTRALRGQIADYLLSFRGMRVEPEQVVVAAGSQVLYNLIVQFLGRDLVYAVETPGYPRLTSIYRANDVRLAHVPLDKQGIDMAGLRATRADVAHIMPSHQFPTGQVTSVSRRYELLGWASERVGRYIVEDDYDCEFRLAGRPIPSLFSVDASSCVVYTNTFAKSLGSSFRMAYMVLPAPLVGSYQEKLGFYSSTVSATEQLALARFISSGEYERHVARTRTYYRSIRNELLEALRGCPVADALAVEAADAGLHFLMRVRADVSRPALVKAARDRGVVLSALSDYCATAGQGPCGAGELVDEPGAAGENTFVMSYAGLLPEQVRPAVEALARAVQDAMGR